MVSAMKSFCKAALSHAGQMVGLPKASNGMPFGMMANAIKQAGPDLGEKLSHIASRAVKRVAPVAQAVKSALKPQSPKGMGA